ncbi:hypothetical protein PR202_gb13752 [Eleusine coracana subsp. coracana]|uniref:C2H2-type domain-containing protein n=1 Tax=Eleusine coracana subsp. coracana TaxID=191504 RepID=A0AAV5ETE5_ELECO|nr:hypothetical protein PR202_gb13752 [Eleusine coracana subsp. coracana]
MGHVETSGTASSNLLQFLSLSLASKVIVKQSKTKRLDDGVFQCRTCGRRFATFQALGGHRTSHKRPARPGKGSGAGNNNVHRCNTCGKVFPTGQAFGGHMRRHRPAAFHAPALEIMMPATMTSSSSSSSSGLTEEGDHDHDAEEDLLPARTLIHFI